MRAWFIVALLSSLALAGCSDSGEAPVAQDNAVLQVEEVETGPEFGAISGVVVDETIVPVPGATVYLAQLQINATADEQGRFAFEELIPGFYTMEISAEDHLPTQTSTEVVAGEVAVVKAQMMRDLAPEPFVELTKFAGHMVIADIYGTWTLQDVLGNTAICECEFTVEAGSTAKTFVLEAVWEPSTPQPDHEIYWEFFAEDGEGYEAGYAASPANFRYSRSLFGGEATQFTTIASSGLVDVDQQFEVFLSVFHNADAPEGYSFVGSA